MSSLKSLSALSRLAVRQIHSSTPKNADAVSSKFQRLKEAQKRFGIEDNTPVYLKGGLTDRLLYGATCIVTFVGLGMSCEVFYKLAIK